MKLCVLFPGIGYTTDKPLLYYTKEIVRKDYEIKAICYKGDPKAAKSHQDRLEAFYKNTYQDVCQQLENVDMRLSYGTTINSEMEKSNLVSSTETTV